MICWYLLEQKPSLPCLPRISVSKRGEGTHLWRESYYLTSSNSALGDVNCLHIMCIYEALKELYCTRDKLKALQTPSMLYTYQIICRQNALTNPGGLNIFSAGEFETSARVIVALGNKDHCTVTPLVSSESFIKSSTIIIPRVRPEPWPQKSSEQRLNPVYYLFTDIKAISSLTNQSLCCWFFLKAFIFFYAFCW